MIDDRLRVSVADRTGTQRFERGLQFVHKHPAFEHEDFDRALRLTERARQLAHEGASRGFCSTPRRHTGGRRDLHGRLGEPTAGVDVLSPHRRDRRGHTLGVCDHLDHVAECV